MTFFFLYHPPSPLTPSLKKYARPRARQAAEHLSDKMAEDVKSPERREMCEKRRVSNPVREVEREREKSRLWRINEACQPFRPHLK